MVVLESFGDDGRGLMLMKMTNIDNYARAVFGCVFSMVRALRVDRLHRSLRLQQNKKRSTKSKIRKKYKHKVHKRI